MRTTIRWLAGLGVALFIIGAIILTFVGAFVCFDTCNSHVLGDMARLAIESLAPGVVATGAAWWIALGKVDRSRHRARFMMVLLALPLTFGLLVGTLMVLNGGWILPANEAQHDHWVKTNPYAYPLLLIWPVAVLVGSGAVPRRQEEQGPHV